MEDVRWQQRFANFEKAFTLLRSTFMENEIAEFSMLEKEGIIQRFEYTYELAWKTLKDYLQYTGVTLEQITPRAVIKAAFAANIIIDGQEWIEMLEKRNEMSHEYNEEQAMLIVENIKDTYTPLLEHLYLFLKKQSTTT